ncbi:hypothetical protein KKF34_19710, partial [Myxococcota bacterium]|nr:hypothetical protein [Myxococcota bacterium]
SISKNIQGVRNRSRIRIQGLVPEGVYANTELKSILTAYESGLYATKTLTFKVNALLLTPVFLNSRLPEIII